MLLATQASQAANIIRMQAPIILGNATEQTGAWIPWQDAIGEWIDVGAPSSCSDWAPLTDTITAGQSFTQLASDCLQSQERTIQPTERNTETLAVRNAGTATTQSQVITTSSTRTAIGTKTVSTTAEFVVTVDNISTQWGYMTNTGRGSMISSTNPDYELNYVSLGYQNKVLVGLAGTTRTPAARYESIKIQMVDSSGAVFYTIASDAILDNYPYSPYYVGWTHTATDYANAKLAKRYIVTLNFKQP
ncbi:hypothetical protein PLA107_030685 (plasmid) [Pseudomonas amygdali pv. lachrymans str. M301315]|nr:hypothetical protein PLA107_030685 [Pseudomonas amygdali pv. lachrymans str. M301315]